MKYCLHCGEICSEDSCQSYFNNNTCETCGYKLMEDDMTASKYNLLSEDEKDKYEQKLLKIIQNSSVFDERLYNMYNKYGTPDFYFYFRFDKYEQMTGKKAGRKITKEEEKELKERIDREYGKNSPAYQQAIIEQCIQADRARKEENMNTVKCQYCNSTNVQKISTTSKVINTAVWGIFGTKRYKQWHCNECGSDF